METERLTCSLLDTSETQSEALKSSFAANLSRLIHKCRRSDSFLPYVLLRYAYYRLRGKRIFANQRTIFRGLNNIETNGMLQVGMGDIALAHKYDRTYLNIRGRLIFDSDFAIQKGCRFDVGENAIARFGRGYVNANTIFVINHGLKVGDGCYIAWGCQILDGDFHEITYEGKTDRENHIEIGNHVWIGSNVTILKGVRIPDGCVVGANSVVTKGPDQENTLIAGNPAQVIKENVRWE